MEVSEIEKAPGAYRQDRYIGAERENGTLEQEIVASSRISLRLWRLYAFFWLVFLIFPSLSLVQSPPSPVRLLIALAGLAIMGAAYIWIMWPHPMKNSAEVKSGLRSLPILFVGLTVLVLYLSLTYGSAFFWLFLGVSAMAGIALPGRAAFWTVMGLTLLTLGLGVWVSGGITSADWLHLLMLALLVRVLGLDMAGLVRLSEALRELHAARQELARQAVMEERLRLARDLHDLLGHSLSMIALKSELAGRLIENDAARAAQEVREVEQAARLALREVRETVAGYRQQTLASELDGARQILEAAGITCTMELKAGPLPADTDAVLAWMVREGVTNVIRHSRARRCLIRITGVGETIRVEVVNDGYREQEATAVEKGSGLSGLAERVAAHGGRIQAGPYLTENGPGFRLQVEFPVQNSTDTQEVKGV